MWDWENFIKSKERMHELAALALQPRRDWDVIVILNRVDRQSFSRVWDTEWMGGGGGLNVHHRPPVHPAPCLAVVQLGGGPRARQQGQSSWAQEWYKCRGRFWSSFLHFQGLFKTVHMRCKMSNFFKVQVKILCAPFLRFIIWDNCCSHVIPWIPILHSWIWSCNALWKLIIFPLVPSGTAWFSVSKEIFKAYPYMLSRLRGD